MYNSKQKIGIAKKEKLIRCIRILLIAALTVIIFYPPYLQGLFFEKHVLPTQIIVFSIFILFLIYKWLKNDFIFFKTALDYVCFGFVVVYFISIFVAVHTRSAIVEWLKYCMYFAVFYMVSDLADDLRTKLLFLWTIVISAVGVSIIGLDAALGGNIVKILNDLFNVLGVKGDLFFGLFVDNRIHSTLQYPNALASYLMAVFFITVGLLMFYNKWWQKAVLGSLAFVVFLTFMLTQSRGAELLFPILVVILLIAVQRGNRIYIITHVILLAIPACIVSIFLFPYLSTDTINQKAPLYILIGLLFTIIISILIRFIGLFLQNIDWKIYLLILSIFIMVGIFGVSYVFNSSIPVELSLLNSDVSKTVSISQEVALKPNKKYLLRFEADAKMKEEKPYAFLVKLFSKNEKDILFYRSKQFVRKEFFATNGLEECELLFSTMDDTKLININFSIYYAGTSVNINNVSIIDAETGKVVKKILLKNKFNLDKIISRFQNLLLKRSVILRIIYYKDGVKIFKDRWLLGAGGGAWNYLYRQYQSYNYSSSQAHNYPLQLCIETGILGIIVLLSLVIIFNVYYIKYYKKVKAQNYTAFVFTAIIGLLLHSVVDFDFAESSMLLFFWTLIALINRELIDSLEIEELRLLNIYTKTNKYTAALKENHRFSIIIGIVISAIILYFSSTLLIASYYAKQSFECFQNGDIETAINFMEKAINLDRNNEGYVIGYNPIASRPDIKAGLIDILFVKNEIYKKAQNNGESIPETDLNIFQRQFSKALLFLNNIEKKAENNLNLTSNLASFYLKTGDVDKGMDYINSALRYFPFEPSLWHAKVDVYYQLMRDYFNSGDYEKAKEYLKKGLDVIEEAKEINKRNMEPFVFKEDTVKLLEIMKFVNDNWDNDAISIVNEVVHYSMFDLDINMDGVPDQWKTSNGDVMNVSIDKSCLSVQVSEKSYLYTSYPLILKKGGRYRVEIKLVGSTDYISCYVSGVTQREIQLIQEDGGGYIAEFLVENDNKSDNQVRIYFEDNCVIQRILIEEIDNK